jgi:hypothetical protein
MTSDKKDDGASAPTRVREIRPAGKPMAPNEPTVVKPMMQPQPQPTPITGGGSSSPTMIKSYSSPPMQKEMAEGESAKQMGMGFDPVVGWFVIVEGPGRGKAVDIYTGMNSLGRSPGQRMRVDFGDASISGEGAAFVTFEPKRGTFHINHGGKANIVYLNDEAVLTPMPLVNGNTVSIGETKFRFVQLCGPDFTWDSMK